MDFTYYFVADKVVSKIHYDFLSLGDAIRLKNVLVKTRLPSMHQEGRQALSSLYKLNRETFKVYKDYIHVYLDYEY